MAMRDLDVRPGRDLYLSDCAASATADGDAAGPLQLGALLVAALAIAFIVANAAFLQSAPHPAPIFQTRTIQAESVSTGASKSTARIATTPAEDAELRRIRKIQTLLGEKGYDVGTVDGVFGARTRDAIMAFERAQGLAPTGKPSDALVARLIRAAPAGVPVPTPPPTAARPQPGAADREDILLVQRALSDLGYGPLEIDGVHGSQTAQAIQRFELDRGLPITGTIDDRIIAELVLIGGVKPLAKR